MRIWDVDALKALLPEPLRQRLRASRRRLQASLPRRRVTFGDLDRLTPISRFYGFDRGLPIDRYYIEAFLARQAADIRGRVLEVGDDSYTRRFGDGRVTQRDVLHVTPGSPQATIVADLAAAPHVPSESFDCIILTQTLQLVYDLRLATATLHRILRPGGVVLATVPGITQIEDPEWNGTWYWSFTVPSARRMFEEAFPATGVAVEAHGNVFAVVAFLHGLAVEELEPGRLDRHDPAYPVLITVRAARPATAP
jgi:SAM-dependent methyltransferase